jgi:hypothetical protein
MPAPSTPEARNLHRGVQALIEQAAVQQAESSMLTVKIRQPSHEFTFGVGMNFILYPLVLTPVV